MRASLRCGFVLGLAGLSLVAAAGRAQSTSTQETPATNSIGPAELQNFSLKGSVTKPADQQPATPPAPRSADRAAADAPPPPTARRAADERRVAREPTPRLATRTPTVEPIKQSPSAPLTTGPDALPSPSASAPRAQEPATAPQPITTPSPEPLAPEDKLLGWPWLLAALVLVGGGAFLLWRRRPREVYVGAPQIDLFAPPEPRPAPTPQPSSPPRPAVEPASTPKPRPLQPKAAAPSSGGIVSTRLRPQIEISVHPLRCVIDDQQLVLDFEIELFNAGATPARSVSAEASLFNAGPTQEQDLAAFFANPAGLGDRLEVLAPMARVSFTSQVIAPRAAIQEYELAGRKALVPVIAFNALYQWSGGPAQTSAAYLVGRETKSEKLGPLGVNGVPREFRSLALRPLPTAVRT
jgi:hypothetical protein